MPEIYREPKHLKSNEIAQRSLKYEPMRIVGQICIGQKFYNCVRSGRVMAFHIPNGLVHGSYEITLMQNNFSTGQRGSVKASDGKIIGAYFAHSNCITIELKGRLPNRRTAKFQMVST